MRYAKLINLTHLSLTSRASQVSPAFVVIFVIAVLGSSSSARAQGGRTNSAASTSLTVQAAAGDHVALEITVRDGAPALVAAASALEISIDGKYAQHVLLMPGSGRTTYDALLGPLAAGTHRIGIARSPLWPWSPEIEIAGTRTKTIATGDELIARAPSLGIRADTIGTASDLPLVLYAEDSRVGGKGWIRYSLILSNEDGGTATPALMARWGRTTDIELIYEVNLEGSRVIEERFQGPDHEMRAVRGEREGLHPYLLIATLNNMVIDRGRSLATIRPAPYVVSLENRTRESVMDDHLWTYRVMARELVAEKRIGTQIEDPRSFLYVEAKLTLENAAVSVQAGGGSTWSDSNRGRLDMSVNRNGWVRIALPAPADAASLRWNCQPTSNDARTTARCDVQWSKAFRLGEDYMPGPNLIDPGSVSVSPGFSEPVPLRRK
jgi:hypothetical protein